MSFSPSQNSDPPSWNRTLYILLFVQIVTTIGFSSIFPFLPLYVASLESISPLSTEVLAGLVFSAQALTMTIASPFWGVLADKWGRKPMVVRATLGGAVIVLLMAFVRTAEELVLLRFIQGMITGVVGSMNALVAGIVPRERMGYAMGLMQVGVGIGVGLGPLIGGVMADAFGYRAAFFITSALLTVAGVVVIFGVDEGFARRPEHANHRHSLLSGWQRIMTSSGVSLTYGLRFLNQVGRMAYYPILPLFVLALIGRPDRVNSYTGLMIGLSSAAMAVFAVVLGNLGDRIGHQRILAVCSLSGCLLFMLQALTQSAGQLLILQCGNGIAMGGIATAISALLAKFTPVGEEGSVYGLDTAITSSARALGPMMGVALTGLWGFRSVFFGIGLLYAAAAALAIWYLPALTAKGREN